MDKVDEVVVGGIRVARITRRALAERMRADCLAARGDASVRPKLIFSVNGNSIARAATDAEFRALYGRADLIHADGQPVVLASRLLTAAPIPERSATTDFFGDAAEEAVRSGLRFYLLGASEAVNLRCAGELERRYPGVKIAGRRHGFFPSAEEAQICAAINASRADVLWVGLGVPLEQNFSVRNAASLRCGWIVTCGGCFNFMAGDYVRAPRWMQRAGLEWLHRLYHEPRRLFWRYAFSNPRAVYLMLTRSGVKPGLAYAPAR